MVQSSFPWGNDGQVGAPEMYQDRWRQMMGAIGDGIVNDLDGESLLVTVASPTQVSVAPGEALIQGVHYLSTTPVTLSRPGAAHDVVMLRYDPATQTVELVVLGGATFPGPAPSQVSDGVWDLPLARISAGVVTDLRRWQAPTIHAEPALSISDPFRGQVAPVGTTLVIPEDPSGGFSGVDPHVMLRGRAGWVQTFPRPWRDVADLAVPGSTDYVTSGGELLPAAGGSLQLPPLRWRQRDGQLQLSGSRARRLASGVHTFWDGGTHRLAVLPRDEIYASVGGRHPMLAQACSEAEFSGGYGETVVPAYLEETDAETLTLWVVLPSGAWRNITIQATIQSTYWVA